MSGTKRTGYVQLAAVEMRLPGRVHCLECLEKGRLRWAQRQKKQSPEQKECHKRHIQRKTDLLRAFGVCVRCQRRDAVPGRAQCAYCLAHSRRYMQARLREKGVMPRDMMGWPGICSRCGKPTGTQEAHRLCPHMPEASQRSMEIARNSRTEKNWFVRTRSWRGANHRVWKQRKSMKKRCQKFWPAPRSC